MAYVTDTTSGSFLQDKVSGTHHREETLCVCGVGEWVGGYVWGGCEKVWVWGDVWVCDSESLWLTTLHAHIYTHSK